MSINLDSVLDESRIDLHLKGSTKDEILREMVDIFDRSGVLNDKDQFLKDVYFRETEGPTGMTNGLCIPHGKSIGVNKSCIAVCRSDKLIEWESLDNNPVNVFVMMAVRDQDKSELVYMLQKVAVTLCDEEVVRRLKTTEDPKEVIALFSNKKED